MGFEKVVNRPSSPLPTPKHRCSVPETIDKWHSSRRGFPSAKPPDWGAGAIWRCDECGEQWTLDWIELPWRALLITPFVATLNFATIGLLMMAGKSGRWRNKKSVRWFVSTNLTLCGLALVWIVAAIAVQ